jgi:hypothetical protein
MSRITASSFPTARLVVSHKLQVHESLAQYGNNNY